LFFSSRRRRTRFSRDWSSDVCSSDLIELELEQKTLSDLNETVMRRLKRRGFSDRRLAFLLDVSESEVRKVRHQLGVRPVYKRVEIGRASCRGGGEGWRAGVGERKRGV